MELFGLLGSFFVVRFLGLPHYSLVEVHLLVQIGLGVHARISHLIRRLVQGLRLVHHTRLGICRHLSGIWHVGAARCWCCQLVGHHGNAVGCHLGSIRMQLALHR